MLEQAVVLPSFGAHEWIILWGVLVSAFAAIGYGAYLVYHVLRKSPGSPEMRRVADAIEEGALSYLARQVKTMVWFVLAIGAVLYLAYHQIYTGVIPYGVAIAFLCGVLASYGAGYVGMWLAIKGNVRSANAALASFKSAMELAFEAGAVSGMFTVGFGLLGATLIFLLFRQNAMKVLVGFGFGGSLAALFMRVGGGIYTKAADVGSDIVGKVEAGIPEDDPRNAAVIADLVGDNVGDCAGMAADVFESYEVTLVAAIILAAAVRLDPSFMSYYGAASAALSLKLIMLPLILRAVGVFSSIIGIRSVRVKDKMRDPMKPITIGFWASAVASVIGFAIVNALYLKNPLTGAPDFRFFLATSMGVVLALVTLGITNWFTHPDYRPVTETAVAAKTGAATLLISGLAEGKESSVWAIGMIGVTILASWALFPESVALSAYAIALTGLGLLTTTGYILAMDTYGPITDNAHGIFEMSGIHNEEASKTLSWMDAIGNTTKALTKGLAIATAVLAAIALFRSFIDEAHLASIGIQIQLPVVFVGLLFGGAIPFLFSAIAMKAVGRAAFGVVEEVRKQFREHPGIMTGREKPDYARVVEIVTYMAQKELLGPGIIAIFSPILVGFMMGAASLGAFLGGAILSGQLLAVYMANAGAIWDNAKKKIEDGFLGGKGTDIHKAAVIGDTVGDPYKDTAGPSLNPLIKVMNLVGILVAPFVIKDISFPLRVTIIAFAIILLIAAVLFSKRGSLKETTTSLLKRDRVPASR